MKKLIIFILRLVILSSFTALAEPNGEPEESCSIFDPIGCVVGWVTGFFLTIFNAPAAVILSWIYDLLTAQVNYSIFYSVWKAIVSITSLFYGFIFLYAGFILLTSSAEPYKRYEAKEWIKNAFIMLILINASFYLYGLLIDISSGLTYTVLSWVDPNFFKVTGESVSNIILQLIFGFFLLITVLFACVILLLRYLLVCFGIIFFPIGIFCYYIPPLKSYGKAVIHGLMVFIFITFLDAIIILGCSMLMSIEVVKHFKILVVCVCFWMVIISLFSSMKIVRKKASESSGGLKSVVKYIGGLIK